MSSKLYTTPTCTFLIKFIRSTNYNPDLGHQPYRSARRCLVAAEFSFSPSLVTFLYLQVGDIECAMSLNNINAQYSTSIVTIFNALPLFTQGVTGLLLGLVYPIYLSSINELNLIIINELNLIIICCSSVGYLFIL